jgi:hypothetical protein
MKNSLFKYIVQSTRVNQQVGRNPGSAFEFVRTYKLGKKEEKKPYALLSSQLAQAGILKLCPN